MIMLAVAVGVVVARKRKAVAAAVRAGGHPIYADCGPGFITAASLAAVLGVAGSGDVTVEAPFVGWPRTGIARTGMPSAPLGPLVVVQPGRRHPLRLVWHLL
jgi:7-cyano-7-deazaguanine synthase in queuosine biosynthesis